MIVTITEIRMDGIRFAKLPAAATVGSLMLPMMSVIVSSRLAITVSNPSCTPSGRREKICPVLSPICRNPASRSRYMDGKSRIRERTSIHSLLTAR